MALEYRYDMNGNRRTTCDTGNPRLHMIEMRCCICLEWFNEEDIVWFSTSETRDGTGGVPYCQSDLPEEADEE